MIHSRPHTKFVIIYNVMKGAIGSVGKRTVGERDKRKDGESNRMKGGGGEGEQQKERLKGRKRE